MPKIMRAGKVSVCPRCGEKIHRGTLILPDFNSRDHAHKDCVLQGRSAWGPPKGRRSGVQGGGAPQDVQPRGSAEQTPPTSHGDSEAARPGT